MKSAFPVTVLASSFACAALMVGCDSKVPGADVATKTSPAPTAASTPPAQADPAVPKTDLARSTLPASLQTDAYHYYGLSNDKPMDMVITTKPDAGVYTGSQQVRMTQADKDSATFIIDRTGTMSDEFGDDTISLKPDAVYAAANSKEKLSGPQVELPTGFIGGKPWKVDTTATAEGNRVGQRMTFSCTGPTTIKFGNTTYPAMLVVGSGTMVDNGKKAMVVMREWFVKDIGNVKAEIVQTPKGGKPVTFTMLWKPTDSKAKS